MCVTFENIHTTTYRDADVVKPSDTPGSDKHHVHEAGYLSEENMNCNQEGTGRHWASVICLFVFKLSGSYTSMCFVTFYMFKTFHNNNKHHRSA